MNPPGTFTTTTVQHQTLYADEQPQRKHLATVRCLGISEIILGVLSLGIGVASLGILHGVGTSGTGVWGGIWFILAGGFGAAAGSKTSNRCLVNTHLTLSIIGAIAAGGQTIWSGALAYGSFVAEEVLQESYTDQGTYPSELARTLFALFTTMSVISGISFIILIVSASYCCCALPSCCKGDSPPPAHVLVTQGNAQHFPATQAVPAKYPGSDYPPPGYAPL